MGAALLTAAAVILVFVLFSGDEPAGQAGVSRAKSPTAAPTPSEPPIELPALPRATALKPLSGTPSPVLGTVTDAKTAIVYSKLGKPWSIKTIPLFSAGQRVGATGPPHTMIASSLFPGAKPVADLKTDAEYRRAALTAVRWTIRTQHPASSEVAWTASQKPATGKGWVLGYRVTYEVGGRKHNSQAALALLDIGRREPAMLFVTVPDTRKRLWADIAPLMAGARAL
ncbi:hypothetical protein [Streptosporangium lutulentum]|uniref:Fibronectin attachment protein n=1 Tax=Streptosporangium lutulentum TaxID=1461250 RepID=A0ABT9QJB7_9ACTN|nr:hypothetical protein [Streptosporangium lutulentum]MDP9846378.1 hypothetical protein [Streptosporangium lutulentum]